MEDKTAILVGFDKLFDLAKDKRLSTLRRLRRLGYVAITRAQEEIYILGAEDRGAFKEVKEILNLK